MTTPILRTTQSFLSTTEVAKCLGITRWAVFNMVKAGRIKAIQYWPGGRYRISESEVDRLLSGSAGVAQDGPVVAPDPAQVQEEEGA